MKFATVNCNNVFTDVEIPVFWNFGRDVPEVSRGCSALIFKVIYSGFGGLGVACWPLVPKFAGSNPAEAVGYLRAKKSSARLPS
jgi:hypothetical protein